jgi:hypothetical protein
VRALQGIGKFVRDGHRGVREPGVLLLVADVRGLPAHILRAPPDPEDELVRVPDELAVATVRERAKFRSGAHADHVEVVGVDDVRPQLVNHLAEGDLEVPQARIELAPRPLAQQRLPEAGVHPVPGAVQCLAASLRTVQLAGAEAHPGADQPDDAEADAQSRPLRKPARTCLVGAQAERQRGESDAKVRLPGTDQLVAVIRDPIGRIGERTTHPAAAELVRPPGQRRVHVDQSDLGTAQLPGGPSSLRRPAEQDDLPPGRGRGHGLFLYARIAMNAVVDEHDDPPSGTRDRRTGTAHNSSSHPCHQLFTKASKASAVRRPSWYLCT